MTAERLAEGKRLAHARTLLMVAQGKVASVSDNHPKRRELQRQLRSVEAKLRARENAHAEP